MKLGKDVNKEVDLEELFDICNRKYFNNQLDRNNIKMEWNKRMTRSLGMVEMDRATMQPIRLAISYKLLKELTYEDLVNVMVHEMIHIKYPNENHMGKFIEELTMLQNKHIELYNLSTEY